MQFTKEDQYITRALTERFKNKYGDVAVIAINDNQIMAISGGLSAETTVNQLLHVIKKLQEPDEQEKTGEENKDEK